MSPKELGRPQDENEFRLREAVGTIRASRFVREYAKSNKPITIEVVYKIQQIIYEEAWPEIAGKLRIEPVELWHSKHLPPHPSQVPALMKELEHQIKERLENLKPIRYIDPQNDKSTDELDNLLDLAAWIHHKITWLHPFRDGNGKTARLMANLVLERGGLIWGLSAEVERENRNSYMDALRQADDHEDYEPLKDIIIEGLGSRFDKDIGRTSLE